MRVLEKVLEFCPAERVATLGMIVVMLCFVRAGSV